MNRDYAIKFFSCYKVNLKSGNDLLNEHIVYGVLGYSMYSDSYLKSMTILKKLLKSIPRQLPVFSSKLFNVFLVPHYFSILKSSIRILLSLLILPVSQIGLGLKYEFIHGIPRSALVNSVHVPYVFHIHAHLTKHFYWHTF